MSKEYMSWTEECECQPPPIQGYTDAFWECEHGHKWHPQPVSTVIFGSKGKPDRHVSGWQWKKDSDLAL